MYGYDCVMTGGLLCVILTVSTGDVLCENDDCVTTGGVLCIVVTVSQQVVYYV